MRWIVELFDIKVLILLFVLLLFIVIALVIVAMENKVKKRHQRRVIERIESTRLAELKRDLSSVSGPKEKLAVIDKHAKKLFSERHGIDSNQTYAKLQEAFSEKQAHEYAGFCEKMFEAYYSNEQLTDMTVKSILKLLTRLIRETEIYLDSEKYDADTLYAKKREEEKEEAQRRVQYTDPSQEMKAHMKKEKMVLKETENMIEAKRESMVKREKELAVKEDHNKEMLQELEAKIKAQEARLREQEKMQREMNSALEEEKELDVKEWRSTIKAEPVSGKDWITNKQSKKKTKSR